MTLLSDYLQTQQSAESATAPWEDPVPLGEVPPVPEFPVDLLPGAARRLVLESAAAVRCPRDYAGVPVLVLAGAAAGSRASLELKPGYRVRPSLYAAVIGPPSCGKTPSLYHAAAPLYRLQAEMHRAFKAAWSEYEAGAAGRLKSEPGPEKPLEEKVYVDDVTREKLAEVLAQSPRGVSQVLDELSALALAMNEYKGGRGSDKQFYLKAWAGVPLDVARKGQVGGSIHVEHPFLAIVGGLVPDLLPLLRGGRALSDGWLDRFLLAYPPEPRAVGEDFVGLADQAADDWGAMLTDLRATPEMELELTGCGKEAWREFTSELAAEMNGQDFPDYLRGPWGKFRDHGARLALTLHLMRVSAKESTADDVDGESVKRAAGLARYFMGHARKVYSTIDSSPAAKDARRVLLWITHSVNSVNSVNGFRVSKRELHAKVLGGRSTVGEVDEVVSVLQRHGYLRPHPMKDRQGPGRKPSPLYEAHPSLLKT